MAVRREVPRRELSSAYRWLAATRPQPSVTRACRGRDGPGDERRGEAVLRALVDTLEQGDPGMRGHAERVGALSHRLAVLLGLSPAEAELVGLAGLLHDIGKIAVVRGRRDGCHDALADDHPVIGAQLVAPFESLTLAAPMIRHHHERLDGSGHPDALRGHAIPIGARIIAVADEYDRLTACPAGTPLARDAALVELSRHAGRTLDSTVISALVELCLP